MLCTLYHDDSLLAVNKPAGLLAVPGRGADKQDCFASRVQNEFTDALVVHQPDMVAFGLFVGTKLQVLVSISAAIIWENP